VGKGYDGLQISVGKLADQVNSARWLYDKLPPDIKKAVDAYNNQNDVVKQLGTSIDGLTSKQQAANDITASGTDNTKLFSQAANSAANYTAVFGGQMGTATSDMMSYIQGLNGAEFSMEKFEKAQIAAGDAAQTITDTVKAQQQAITDARTAYQQSIQSVTDAGRSSVAADRAVVDAHTAVTVALRGVATAEKALTKAQQDEVTAQKDLVTARKTAQDQLASYSRQVTDQTSSEESAQLRLIQAQQAVTAAGIDQTKVKLTDLFTAKTVTPEQEAQYQLLLSLQDAQNAVNDTTATGVTLRQNAADAQAAGVEGSAGVIAAQQKVASSHDAVSSALDQISTARDAVVKADQRVSDAEYAAKKAHDAVSAAQIAEGDAAGKLADAKHAASDKIDINTAAGRSNFDMLLRLYDADVAAGQSTDQIKISMENAGTQIGLNIGQTDALVTSLGTVPLDTPFDVTAHPTMDPTGLLQAAQAAGIDISSLGFSANAITAFESLTVNPRANAKPKATGGPIDGSGGPTEDNILIRASAREFMQPVSAVDHYGLPFMESIRTRQFPRFADGGLVAATQGIIRTAGSEPYVWGAVGPGSYDCSGLAGEVYAHLLGLPDYRRYFTTLSNFGQLGFRPGVGTFTIGVSPTHMVGNLGGLGFEAQSSHSRPNIKIGSAATDVMSMPQQWYLPQVGNSFVGSAGNPFAALGGQYGSELVKTNYRLATYGALVSSLGKSARLLGAKGIPAAPFPAAGPWPPVALPSFGPAGDTGASTSSAATAQAYAASQLAAYGWGADQMSPLVKLWNQESGWNANAVNRSSGAAGIAQSLGHGPVALGDYMGQINWGLNYIRGRYGSPAGAWSHEVADNWYDSGGWLPPGPYNGTGRPEAVLTPDESAGLRAAVQQRDMRLDAYTIDQMAQAFVLAASAHPLQVTVSDAGRWGVAGL
jgi:hypothetical protein